MAKLRSLSALALMFLSIDLAHSIICNQYGILGLSHASVDCKSFGFGANYCLNATGNGLRLGACTLNCDDSYIQGTSNWDAFCKEIGNGCKTDYCYTLYGTGTGGRQCGTVGRRFKKSIQSQKARFFHKKQDSLSKILSREPSKCTFCCCQADNCN